jgi:hypothetical protein
MPAEWWGGQTTIGTEGPACLFHQPPVTRQ